MKYLVNLKASLDPYVEYICDYSGIHIEFARINTLSIFYPSCER